MLRLPMPGDGYNKRDEAEARRLIELEVNRLGAPGESVYTADEVDALIAALEPTFVGARAYSVAGQSIPNNTETLVALDAERFDTDGFHDNSTNNSRLTCPAGKAGKYVVTANVVWAFSSLGVRKMEIYVGDVSAGTAIPWASVTMDPATSGSYNSHQNAAAIVDLEEGDYVEIHVVQTTGGSLTLGTWAAYSAELSLGLLAAGGGGTPKATDSLTGTVKTDVTEADPVVYTKASMDTLLATKSNTSHTHSTLPSSGEKDALVGTSGTPGTANKYVTDADPRLPTTDEKAALVGTDGTPSAANPYVTDSDPRLDAPSFVGARVYNSTTTNVANATYTALPFDSERYDTDGFHSTSVNPSRLTVPAGQAGKYLLWGGMDAAGGGTGYRQLMIVKNAAVVLAAQLYAASGYALQDTIVTTAELAEGDYVEFWFYHTQGSTLSVWGGSTEYGNEFSMTLLTVASGGGGGGSTPLASSTTTGTVKTDVDEVDPVVYTKASVDALLVWSRGDVTVTTASLADTAEENGTIALGKSFIPFRVTVDRACRVRLYQTAAARTADNTRPPGTDPTGEHGVILDLRLDALTGLEWDVTDPPTGMCMESSVSADIPYCIKNESGATSTVQVTVRRLLLET